jgi:hypothetical protein
MHSFSHRAGFPYLITCFSFESTKLVPRSENIKRGGGYVDCGCRITWSGPSLTWNKPFYHVVGTSQEVALLLLDCKNMTSKG